MHASSWRDEKSGFPLRRGSRQARRGEHARETAAPSPVIPDQTRSCRRSRTSAASPAHNPDVTEARDSRSALLLSAAPDTSQSPYRWRRGLPYEWEAFLSRAGPAKNRTEKELRRPHSG